MGSSHSSAGQMAASFKTPPFAPPNRFHGRRHLQRYCICPHCSYNYRAGRRGCDACGNRWKQKFGERLAVPEQPHHVRQVRSIDGGELNQIMQLGLPEEAKRDLLGSCVGKYEPSRKPVDDDGNDEEVSTASVDVLGNHAGAHNPSIILTSVDDAKPTMDSCTWGALEMDSNTKAAQAVNMVRKQSVHKPRHVADCMCGRCRNAVTMNTYFQWMMGIDNVEQDRGSSNRAVITGEEKQTEVDSSSGDSSGIAVVKVEISRPSTVRIFLEDLSIPGEPALLFPTHDTVSPRQGTDDLRDVYLTQGSELQD